MCYNIHDHVCRSEVLLRMLKCGAIKLHVVLVLCVLNAMVSDLSSFIIYFSFKTILKTKQNKTKKLQIVDNEI